MYIETPTNSPGAVEDSPILNRSGRESRASAEQKEIDAKLMQRVASGDQQAMQDLSDRFKSLIYRLAYNALHNKSDAEDQAQEVLLKLWRSADRYDAKRAALVTWVMMITRRQLIDANRRTHTRITTSSLVESWVSAKEDTQLLEMEREGEADALQQKIAQLPGKASKLINMHYFEGNTISEVSRKTGEKVGTIKSSMTRGRQTLKKILERENAGR